MLGASLDERQAYGIKEAKKDGRPWVPDDTWRADFDKVSNCVSRMQVALREALEGQAKQLAGMTAEQLEAQLRAELVRLAPQFTHEEWALLDKVRMKQFANR